MHILLLVDPSASLRRLNKFNALWRPFCRTRPGESGIWIAF